MIKTKKNIGRNREIKKEVEQVELLKLEQKENITSIELLEIINKFRNEEREKSTKKIGVLKHKTILIIIREEIGEQNILPTSYVTKQNKKQPMYILTLQQAKQVLLKESREVRRKVIEYIEGLESELKREIEKNRGQSRLLGKTVRALETDTLKKLIETYNIPKEKQNYIYSNYTRLAYRVMGYKEKPEREKMGENELNLLQQIEAIISLELINNMSNKKPLKEIYINCKNKAVRLYSDIKKLYTQEEKNNYIKGDVKRC